MTQETPSTNPDIKEPLPVSEPYVFKITCRPSFWHNIFMFFIPKKYRSYWNDKFALSVSILDANLALLPTARNFNNHPRIKIEMYNGLMDYKQFLRMLSGLNDSPLKFRVGQLYQRCNLSEQPFQKIEFTNFNESGKKEILEKIPILNPFQNMSSVSILDYYTFSVNQNTKLKFRILDGAILTMAMFPVSIGKQEFSNPKINGVPMFPITISPSAKTSIAATPDQEEKR